MFVIVLIIIITLIVVGILLTGYVKASPNTAYIISGLKSQPRILMGRAGVKIPFFEKKDQLTLELISIDIKTARAVPTADYINISVDAVVNVQIGPEMIGVASRNFLNRKPEYIAQVAGEVLEGNMREIVGQMNLENMVSDRKMFAEKVIENAKRDLEAMGLVITNFNVQNFKDENEVIDNLGIDNIVKIQKKAAISRAESEKDIAVAQANADLEAKNAEIDAKTKMAQRDNELAIREAELKAESDIQKAKADASYKIEAEEQRKTVEIATTQANIAKAEQEAELRAKEVAVKQQTLAAEIEKQADAEKYAEQTKADAALYARTKEAEAKRIEQEEYAKGVEAVGKAEAQAIELKGLAEAKAMEEKANAYERYGQAVIAEGIVEKLPEIAAAIAEPLAKIGDVKIYGGGSDNGMGSISGMVPTVMAQLFESVKSATGVDLADIQMANGTKAKMNRNINLTGTEAVKEVIGSEILDQED